MKLWHALVNSLNIPEELVQIIRNMYIESTGISVDANTGDFYTFLANLGVKQGDGTSPELFILFFDRVFPFVQAYFKKHNIDGSKRRAYTIASLQLFLLSFADDIVLIAPSPRDL